MNSIENLVSNHLYNKMLLIHLIIGILILFPGYSFAQKKNISGNNPQSQVRQNSQRLLSKNNSGNLFKLEPFKLKKLPPKKDKRDPLDYLKVRNERTDIKKPITFTELGIRTGFVLALTGINTETNWDIPYISLYYRPDYLRLSSLFYGEFELVYFRLTSKDSFADIVNVETHTIMPFLSFGMELKASRWYNLHLQLGLGASFQLVYREIVGVPSTLQQFDQEQVNILGVAKFALHNSFRISTHFNISVGADLFVPFDPNGLIVIVSPNIGFGYMFDLDYKAKKKKAKKEKVDSEFGVHTGIIFALDQISGDTNIGLPYVSLSYRPSFLKMIESIYWEAEIIYFYMTTSDNLLKQKGFHSLMPVISLVYPIRFSGFYSLTVKVGGGLAFQLAQKQSNATGVANNIHQFEDGSFVYQGVARAGLQNEFTISQSLKFFLNGDFIWQLSPNGVITYISPNIGLGFSF